MQYKISELASCIDGDKCTSSGGRNFAKNLAIGAGITGLALGGKKEKVLKKGDGLKTVGKVDVRYGLTGSSKKGQGGKIYNPDQMAKLGKVQKNFIDKYNKKARINPFKKQIQYKPKGDGTYTILDPKKKWYKYSCRIIYWKCLET